MRFSVSSTLVVALAVDATVASTWFGKKVYNKWHETELERWLSDHNIPYPTPADRKDLEIIVVDNWNDKVVAPYNSWNLGQLQAYLKSRGQDVKKGTENNRDALVSSVKSAWYQTEDQASDAYNDVKVWIFDSWTDSQLKAFCDRNGIPVPQPRSRDSLLKTARENYQSAAKTLGQTTFYPGNWLYESWSESELKSWLDERGYPVPQPTSKDKLIAEVRRNSHLAQESMRNALSSATASAYGTQHSLTDALIDAWSDSQIKEWADKNGIKVPQGSRRDELVALMRKHRSRLTGDNVKSSAASAFGAATSSAGNEYAQATRGAYNQGNAVFDAAAGYVNWVKNQIGLGSGPEASASSASSAASSRASSLSSVASKSSSSASSAAAKSGKKAADAAGKSAAAAANRAAESAAKVTDRIKQEL